MRTDEELREMRFWSVFSVVWIVFVLMCVLQLFSGCGPNVYGPPVCTTRCGLELQTMTLSEDGTPWTCEEFQLAEDRTEAAFQRVFDARLVNYCLWMPGWKVYVDQRLTWRGQSGEMVAGETYCASSLMVVNNANNPRRSSFPHEAAHALQRCRPMSDRYEGGHAEWEDQKILEVVGAVWGEAYDEMVDAGLRP